MGVSKNPQSFKMSVEQRLRTMLRQGAPNLNRRRVLLVMERFIARVNHALPDSALLKGGLALELRLNDARTTKDIDLRLLGNSDDLNSQLRKMEEFRPDPEDFLHFKITPDNAHPTVTGDGVRYDGFRFKVRADIANRQYANFGLDVAYGDPILGKPDTLQGTSFFEKYDIPPVTVRAYPPTTHLAEKLHAYTLPRDSVNTRLKDLVDMPLLAMTLDEVTVSELRQAFEQTFKFRNTHKIPTSLPKPPIEWQGRYDRLAKEEELEWDSLDGLYKAAATLVDPILEGAERRWSAEARRWADP